MGVWWEEDFWEAIREYQRCSRNSVDRDGKHPDLVNGLVLSQAVLQQEGEVAVWMKEYASKVRRMKLDRSKWADLDALIRRFAHGIRGVRIRSFSYEATCLQIAINEIIRLGLDFEEVRLTA